MLGTGARLVIRAIAAAFLIGGAFASARADLAYELERYVGYSIVAVLRIEGYVDENGKRGDAFEGCEFGRTIVFEGRKALTCQGYGYSYGYRPTAVILARSGSFVMIVNGSAYDMRN